MGNANSGRRKPVALRAYEGNRSKTPLPVEPPTRPLVSNPPDGLSAEVRRDVWDRVVSVLTFAGLLQERDWLILTQACRHYDRMRLADEEVKQFGIVVESMIGLDESGRVVEVDDPKARFAKSARKINPAVLVSERSSAAFERCLSKLGLSPSDWVKLAAPKTPKRESLLTG